MAWRPECRLHLVRLGRGTVIEPQAWTFRLEDQVEVVLSSR